MRLTSILVLLLSASCRQKTEFSSDEFAEHYLHCLKTGIVKSAECGAARKKTDEFINRVLSAKKEMPFGKVDVDPVKSRTIREIFRNDASLEVRYGILWEEFSQ